MSLWTYFHASIVTENPIPENYFGKELKEKKYPDYSVKKKLDKEEFDRQWKEVNQYNNEQWDAFDADPESYLPAGSEGTLRYVWQNKKLGYTWMKNMKTAYGTKIIGALRDFSDSKRLCDWFKSLTEDLKEYKILQAFVSAESDLNGTHHWSYQSIAMDEKYCLKNENIF